MISKSDLTILLTGLPWRPERKPFHPESAERAWISATEWLKEPAVEEVGSSTREERMRSQIENYLLYSDNIIISTYDYIHPYYYLPYYNGYNEKVSIKIIEEPTVEEQILYDGWFYTHQVLHLLRASKDINTKYLLRSRFDEYYQDLTRMLDVFSEDTKKIIGSNTNWPVHMPTFMDDKFYLGETRILQRAYSTIMEMLEKREILPLGEPWGHSGLYSSEYVTTIHLKRASEFFYPKESDNEMMLDRFRLVDITEFKECKIAHRGGELDMSQISNLNEGRERLTEQILKDQNIKLIP